MADRPRKKQGRRRDAPLAKTHRPAGPATGSPAAPSRPDLQLTIAADDMEAVVSSVYPGTTEGQIASVLARREVVFGVDVKGVRRALKAAADSGLARHHIVVARGRSPRPPVPGPLEYKMPPGMASLPDLEPLRKRLSAPTREQLLEALPTSPVWAVGSGDLLAVASWRPGESGCTVFGQEVPPLPRQPQERLRQARHGGHGVDVSVGATEFRAARWGYVGLTEDRLHVLAPVWVRADGAEAHLVCPPWTEGSRGPSPEDLAGMLTTAGVCEGIDEEALRSLSELLSHGPPEDPLQLLARGRAPLYPRSAELRFGFPHRPGGGSVAADGSIEFRERNVFPAVSEGGLLVECRLAVPGHAGMSVRGRASPVGPPRRARLEAGANTRLETTHEAQRLFAEIDGGAIVRTDVIDEEGPITRHTVAVEPVTQIAGDVDLHSGKVDVAGNLIVSGSVMAGAQVTAAGDVAISGSVEAGARVVARGNVTVKQGIVGDKTQVEAGGGIAARFVQDATLEASADIVLGSYAFGATIRTFGRLQVDGAGGAGGISGGRCWALQGIKARNLGSAANVVTEVLVGLQRDAFAKVEKLRSLVGRVEEALARLLTSMGMEAFEAQAVRQVLATATDETTRRCAQQTEQLAKARDRFASEVETLSGLLQQGWGAVTVEVPQVVYSGTVVHVGDHKLDVATDLKAVCLGADAAGGVAQK